MAAGTHQVVACIARRARRRASGVARQRRCVPIVPRAARRYKLIDDSTVSAT
eukprot:SAG31_NODE_24817_length_473_cov_1.745989_1_plen_51_part_10